MIPQKDQNTRYYRLIVRRFKENFASYVLDIYYDSYIEIYRVKSREDVQKIELEMYGASYPYLSEDNLINTWKAGILEIYIGVLDNIITAFASIIPWSKNKVYIDEFHVRKEFRGRGIGKLFLKKLENVLSRKHINKIVLDAHINSVGFFKKMGYRESEKTYGNYVRLYKVLNHL